jgi:predicted  nucleic acid-binding Zn-ribbon protein|tara:strand:+ start:297 stop:482 length:186 start_codon:yes stop_codon:yes gene_type:complete
MIDPLDYDRSIMELQLKKQKLEEEIADIDNVLQWMNEQKQELLNTTDDLTTEIFKDILGKN